MQELTVLASELGQSLSRSGLMLATAESCTGGWVAKAVTDVPGSSAWFERGFVTYTNESKIEMLGVNKQTLAEHGAVSEATVREMAQGALDRSRAQVSVSISGIAGPGGGSPDKPVGTVWMAWATKDGCSARRFNFTGDRDQVRYAAVTTALSEVNVLIKGRD